MLINVVQLGSIRWWLAEPGCAIPQLEHLSFWRSCAYPFDSTMYWVSISTIWSDANTSTGKMCTQGTKEACLQWASVDDWSLDPSPKNSKRSVGRHSSGNPIDIWGGWQHESSARFPGEVETTIWPSGNGFHYHRETTKLEVKLCRRSGEYRTEVPKKHGDKWNCECTYNDTLLGIEYHRLRYLSHHFRWGIWCCMSWSGRLLSQYNTLYPVIPTPIHRRLSSTPRPFPIDSSSSTPQVSTATEITRRERLCPVFMWEPTIYTDASVHIKHSATNFECVKESRLRW